LFLIRAFLIVLSICSLSIALSFSKENNKLKIQYQQLRADMARNENFHIKK